MGIMTISGLPGAGKTTVGEMLAEKLNYKFYSVGFFRRKLAESRGLTIQELNALGETNSWTDKLADDWQIELSKKEDNFIFEGRLSYHFIPNSFKVFLIVDAEEGAKRIFKEERSSEKKVKSIQEQVNINTERISSDVSRYKKHYNIDNCYNYSNFDLVVDTTNLTPKQVAQRIYDEFKLKDL